MGFDEIMEMFRAGNMLRIETGARWAYVTEERFNLHKPYTVRVFEKEAPANWRELPGVKCRTLNEAILLALGSNSKWCDRDGTPL